MEAGLARSPSLTECRFELGPGESDEQVSEFAHHIAALCTIAAGVGVGVAVINFSDSEGVVRRIIPQPVTARYSPGSRLVDDFHLPEFFEQVFDPFLEMQKQHSPWRKLASYCGALEDAPYLEQRFASLMMAVEFFFRNLLLEKGETEHDVARLSLKELIGAVRRRRGWPIPKHYTAGEAVRFWRNAVMHGLEWPSGEKEQFRRLLDKWRLLFFRLVLVRLGYSGKVIAPHAGWAVESDVADLSEEYNSFEPRDPNNAHLLATLVKKIEALNGRKPT